MACKGPNCKVKLVPVADVSVDYFPSLKLFPVKPPLFEDSGVDAACAYEETG